MFFTGECANSAREGRSNTDAAQITNGDESPEAGRQKRKKAPVNCGRAFFAGYFLKCATKSLAAASESSASCFETAIDECAILFLNLLDCLNFCQKAACSTWSPVKAV